MQALVDRLTLTRELNNSLNLLGMTLSMTTDQNKAVEIYRRISGNIALLFIAPDAEEKGQESGQLAAVSNRLSKMFLETGRYGEEEIHGASHEQIIVIAACTFLYDCSRLMIDSDDAEDSVEVLRTRVDALIAQWVDYFLGKEDE